MSDPKPTMKAVQWRECRWFVECPHCGFCNVGEEDAWNDDDTMICEDPSCGLLFIVTGDGP